MAAAMSDAELFEVNMAAATADYTVAPRLDYRTIKEVNGPLVILENCKVSARATRAQCPPPPPSPPPCVRTLPPPPPSLSLSLSLALAPAVPQVRRDRQHSAARRLNADRSSP